MRNSGPTNGAGSKLSPAVHPFDLLAARSAVVVGQAPPPVSSHASAPACSPAGEGACSTKTGEGASPTTLPKVARITRVHGPRGVELAEKAGRGWRRRHAFTRVELCACLAAGALLVLLALPALATSQSRGQVAQCLNNLRQMGRAVQMWESDFNQTLPPWRVPPADGGTAFNSTRPGNAWVEFLTLSNQLVTPRILACPADEGLKVASSFPEFSTGLFRNNGASYFINLHTSVERPETALFGDRNLSLGGSESCSLTGIINSSGYSPTTAWTNAVHGLSGNIVAMDGRVAQTSTPQLKTALLRSQAEGPSVVHLLKPR